MFKIASTYSDTNYTDYCTKFYPIQESYSLLAKYQISVAREEADKVDTFRFAWQKLNTLAVSLSYYYLAILMSISLFPESNMELE